MKKKKQSWKKKKSNFGKKKEKKKRESWEKKWKNAKEKKKKILWITIVISDLSAGEQWFPILFRYC